MCCQMWSTIWGVPSTLLLDKGNQGKSRSVTGRKGLCKSRKFQLQFCTVIRRIISKVSWVKYQESLVTRRTLVLEISSYAGEKTSNFIFLLIDPPWICLFSEGLLKGRKNGNNAEWCLARSTDIYSQVYMVMQLVFTEWKRQFKGVISVQNKLWEGSESNELQWIPQ